MKGYKYLFFVFVFYLSSCETDVEVDAPYYESKVVISGTICPDFERTYIKIGLTTLYIGPVYPNYSRLNNAIVKLSGNGNEIALQQISFQNTIDYNGIDYYCDSSQFKIVKGETYHIEVLLADGTVTSASTTVPDTLPGNFEVVDYVAGNEGSNFRIRFEDIKNQRNYYRLIFYENDLYSFNNMISDEFIEDYFGGVSFDGKMLYSKKIDNYFMNPSGNYFIRLFLTDENFYRFHTTYQNLPPDLFTEPSLIFTNVEGGVGYFGSVVYIEQPINITK